MGTVDFNAQALVNQEIFNQLTKLGNRLDALEKGDCKKTKDRTKITSTTSKSKSKRQKDDQPPISQNTVRAASSLKNEHIASFLFDTILVSKFQNFTSILQSLV